MSDFVKSTTINGTPVLQELSDSDISDLADYLLYYYANQANTSRGLPHIVSGTTGNAGTFHNTYRTEVVGTHPAASTTATVSYSFNQNRTANNNISSVVYPIRKATANSTFISYVPSYGIGNTNASETITEILTAATSKVASSSSEVGNFYITNSTASLPGGSTNWAAIQSNAIQDTVQKTDGSGTTNTNYSLYVKRNPNKPSIPKLVKRDGTNLKEMSEADVQSLLSLVVNRFVNSGINNYTLTAGTSAPLTPAGSSWVSAGTITNTIRNVGNVNYDAGSYAGSRDHSYFRGSFLGILDPGYYTGEAYTAIDTTYYTRLIDTTNTVVYTRYRNVDAYYTGNYTQYVVYTNYRDSTNIGSFVGAYNNLAYATFYTGVFTRGVGNYAGTFARVTNSAYFTTTYTGAYVGPTGTYNQPFTGNYALSWARTNYFTGAPYTGYYTSSFVGAYPYTRYRLNQTLVYTRNRAIVYSRPAIGTFTSTQASSWISHWSRVTEVGVENLYLGFYRAFTRVTPSFGRNIVFTRNQTEGWVPSDGYYTGYYTASQIEYYTRVSPVATSFLRTVYFTGTYSAAWLGTVLFYFTKDLGYYTGTFNRAYGLSYAGYTRFYWTRAFLGSYFRGAFTGTVNVYYTGYWSRGYATTFGYTSTVYFTGLYVNFFNRIFTRNELAPVFVGATGLATGYYTSATVSAYYSDTLVFNRGFLRTVTFSRAFTGIYTGTYAAPTFAGIAGTLYYTAYYTGTYTTLTYYTGYYTRIQGFSKGYTGVYTRIRVTDGPNYAMTWLGVYNTPYTRLLPFSRGFDRSTAGYLAQYSTVYTGTFFRGSYNTGYARYFTRTVNKTYTINYSYVGYYTRHNIFAKVFHRVLTYTGFYTAVYTNIGVIDSYYTRYTTLYYSRPYTRFIDSFFTKGVGYYTGTYSSSYSRGLYTEPTILTAATTTTYTLWKRVA